MTLMCWIVLPLESPAALLKAVMPLEFPISFLSRSPETTSGGGGLWNPLVHHILVYRSRSSPNLVASSEKPQPLLVFKDWCAAFHYDNIALFPAPARRDGSSLHLAKLAIGRVLPPLLLLLMSESRRSVFKTTLVCIQHPSGKWVFEATSQVGPRLILFIQWRFFDANMMSLTSYQERDHFEWRNSCINHEDAPRGRSHRGTPRQKTTRNSLRARQTGKLCKGTRRHKL